VIDFDKLSLFQQYAVLCNKGRLVASLNHDSRKINLYMMGGKYYEMWYDAAGNLIETIEEMKDIAPFKKYFEEK
jgi:hypothetical protein